MKEWFYRLRFNLAYWICPEYVDDMEERLSGLLCHTTAGLLSKTNYTLDEMIRAVDDYQMRCCDECEHYFAEFCRNCGNKLTDDVKGIAKAKIHIETRR